MNFSLMNLRLEKTAEPIATALEAYAIRRGVAADATALAAFAAHTFTDTYGAYNSPANLQMYLASSCNAAQQGRELADPDVATLLAYRHSELAAYAQVRRGSTPPCISGAAPIELLRFYVDKAWHGHGIAQRLLGEVQRAALELGGATLWLKVWENNPRAIAFYRKANFVEVGVADFFVGTDRQTDRVLAMDLRDPPLHATT